MSFLDDCNNIIESNEKRKEKPTADLSKRKDEVAAFSEHIRDSIKFIIKNEKYSILKDHTKQVHFFDEIQNGNYKSIDPFVTITGLSKGWGVFRGTRETKFEITFDLNEDLEEFIAEAASHLKNDGIIVSAPRISNNIKYYYINYLNDWSDSCRFRVITSANFLDAYSSTYYKWKSFKPFGASLSDCERDIPVKPNQSTKDKDRVFPEVCAILVEVTFNLG